MTVTDHTTSLRGVLFTATEGGREVTYGRWGAGPRWHATLRHPGAYLRHVSRWFDSQEAAEAWRDAVLAAAPEQVWAVAEARS